MSSKKIRNEIDKFGFFKLSINKLKGRIKNNIWKSLNSIDYYKVSVEKSSKGYASFIRPMLLTSDNT